MDLNDDGRPRLYFGAAVNSGLSEASDSGASSSDEDERQEYAWAELVSMLPGYAPVVEVPASYLGDNFNWHGIKDEVRHYSSVRKTVRSMVRGRFPAPACEDPPLRLVKNDPIFTDALHAYALIHQRFLLTAAGMEMARRKFLRGDFGTCPRYLCQKQHCLPYGTSETYAVESWLKYCPRCNDLHRPNPTYKSGRENYLDGAFFGRTFASFFIMQHPSIKAAVDRNALKGKEYVPRVFGFKVATGQRLKQLQRNAKKKEKTEKALKKKSKKSQVKRNASRVGASSAKKVLASPPSRKKKRAKH